MKLRLKIKQGVFAVAVFLFVLITLIIYGYNATSLFASGIQKLLPKVFVGAKTLSVYDVRQNLEVVRRFGPNVSAKFAQEQLINRTKEKILAANLGLEWKGGISEELKFQAKVQRDYEKFLRNYFDGNENLFIKYVIDPVVVETALKRLYNADYRLNFQAYNKVETLLKKILKGENFEELAKQESADAISAPLGGDLGFFAEGDLLPELENQVRKGPMGEIQRQIFISRLGYHIIYPIETAEKNGATLWHAKHILIQSEGFDSWFTQKTAKIKVRYLIK